MLGRGLEAALLRRQGTDKVPPQYDDLAKLLTAGWECLTAPTGAPGDVAGLVALATMGADGPETRFVVLRAVDTSAACVAVFTDSATTKVAELSHDPRSSLLRWSPADQLQVRLVGRLNIKVGAEIADKWTSLPEPSRANYGVTPAPGTPIASVDAYQRRPDPARLAVLTLTVERIDIVHLGASMHVRARYRRANNWRGQWLAP